MEKNFLLAVDGSEGSKTALEFALDREKANSAQLIAIHVIEWSPYGFYTPDELSEREKKREGEIQKANDQFLSPVAAQCEQAGVECSMLIKHGNSVDVINKTVSEHNVLQVFMGRRGASAHHILFGSLASKLVQTCAVPVTIVP